MKLEMIISIASATAAFLSVIFSYRSTQISKKSLRISEKEHDSRAPKLIVYLKESFKKKYTDNSIFAFAVSYTNQSDLSNSLVRIDLKIFYSKKNGTTNNILFPLLEENILDSYFSNLSRFHSPVDIGSRSSISGWLFFKVPTEAINGYVEKYQVVAVTASDNFVEVNTYLMKEIYDEKS